MAGLLLLESPLMYDIPMLSSLSAGHVKALRKPALIWEEHRLQLHTSLQHFLLLAQAPVCMVP